jgi:uncharacterized protein (TIGR01777 family)
MKPENFKATTKIKADIHTAFQWHEREGALFRLTPPWEKIELLEKDEGIDVGAKCNINVATGFFSIPWQAEHIEYYKDKHFKDRQNKGPFSMWEHSHDFEESNGTTTITDSVDYKLPLHFISKYVAGSFIRTKLKRMFRYRKNVSKNDIEFYDSYKPEPKNIIISGASGAVGSALVPFLQTQGHSVKKMVRHERQLCIDDVCWNPSAGEIDEKLFGNPDVVIHLAGEPIGEDKWTNEKKVEIVDSRTRSTTLIANTLAKMEKPPKVLICASAIGYYGDRGDEEIDESSKEGKDFISHVCFHWERAAKPAIDRGIRVVFLRIGVALTPSGGALQRMYTPSMMGLCPVFGSGEQYLSWISMDDVLYSVGHIIETDSIEGAVNLTSPNPVRFRKFSNTLAKILKRPRFVRIPEFAVKAMFGQMGKEVLLSGAKVQPKKLIDSGFKFRYPDIDDALKHLLGRE